MASCVLLRLRPPFRSYLPLLPLRARRAAVELFEEPQRRSCHEGLLRLGVEVLIEIGVSRGQRSDLVRVRVRVRGRGRGRVRVRVGVGVEVGVRVGLRVRVRVRVRWSAEPRQSSPAARTCMARRAPDPHASLRR